MSTSKIIGVYGTLRKGQSANLFLDDSTFIKTVTVKIPYIMIDTKNGYPALVKNITQLSPIMLDLFRITEETEKQLDYYEGYPHLFDKDTITIDQEPVTIYIYNSDYYKQKLAQLENCEKLEQLPNKIHNGDWVSYVTDFYENNIKNN